MSDAAQFSKEEKETARKLMRNAIKDGTLVRQPCEECGSTKSVAGHHPDYSRPLDVRWLCASHHAEEHDRLSRREGPQFCECCKEWGLPDSYTENIPPDEPFQCMSCINEGQLFAVLRAFNCLTCDGKLTGQLDVIINRHYPSRYS